MIQASWPKPGTSAAKLPDWITMLLSFDFEFRRRRLNFVIQRITIPAKDTATSGINPATGAR